ncbi:MAG: glycosyltransferase [Lachnospiraceae bacterium]|nr:glycosyltransferase [Lachnospiraceae bacterium]MDE7272145.1 glycosyltransferase [Lachnospiraceae bacterium]
MQFSVDVIVLTYKPGKQVMDLIRALEEQTYPIRKIIIMNTEERYFYNLFYGTGFLEKYKNIEVHHLSEKEFDHGRTRAKAVQYSKSDIFVCMTQDAMPVDAQLIQNLVDALMGQERIAAAYARQLPLPDCREIEKYTRDFNYPDQSSVRSAADVDRLGVKTFFCSNVCAAYNREIYENIGGFVKKAIFNEDMVFAGHAVTAGYRIAYAAEAKVRHSHNYTCMQQFRRNFDLGVSQAEHPEVFDVVSSESEGIKLVKNTIKHLEKTKKRLQIPYLIISSGYKLIGYQLGKHYRSLPKGMVRWCSASKTYWS